MSLKLSISIAMLCSFFTSFSQTTTNFTSDRPDGHAPLSVMGDHVHGKNEIMLSYRYMEMNMEGILNESNESPLGEVLNQYMISPTTMKMKMHMLGAMYAPSDILTLMVMSNYTTKEMNLVTRMGNDFDTVSEGFGDTSISALFKLINQNKHRVHARVGVSLPTGSLTQSDDTPAVEDLRLAYPMQLGSGTVDPTLAVTYVGQVEKFSWGAQVTNTSRFFDNSDGFDENFNPAVMPLFDSNNSGRSQTDIGLGANYYVKSGPLKSLRFAGELLLPISQKVNGFQMENQTSGVLGIQYSLNQNADHVH